MSAFKLQEHTPAPQAVEWFKNDVGLVWNAFAALARSSCAAFSVNVLLSAIS